MERLWVIIIFGLVNGTDTSRVELVPSRPKVVAGESLRLTCTYRGNDTVTVFDWKFDGNTIAVVRTSPCQSFGYQGAPDFAFNYTFTCPSINSNLFTIEMVPKSFHGKVVSCMANMMISSNDVTLIVQSPIETTEYITATVVDSTSTIQDPISPTSKAATSDDTTINVTEPSQLHGYTTANAFTTNSNQLNEQTASSADDSSTFENNNASTYTYTTRAYHDEATINKLSTSASGYTTATAPSPTRLKNDTSSSMYGHTTASAKITTPSTYTSMFYDKTTSTNEYPSASDTTPKYFTATHIDASPATKETKPDDTTTNVTEPTQLHNSTTTNTLTTNSNELNDQTTRSEDDTYTTRGSHDEATITELDTTALENTRGSTDSTRLNDETTSTNEYTSASAKVTTTNTYTSRVYDETTGTYEYTSASAKVTTSNTYTSRVYDETTGTYEYTSASAKVTTPNTYTPRLYDETTSTYEYTSASAKVTTPKTYTSRVDDETTGTYEYTSASAKVTTPNTYTSRAYDETTGTYEYTSASAKVTTPITYTSMVYDETTGTYEYTSASAKVTTPNTYTSRAYDETTGTYEYTSASAKVTTPNTYTSRAYDETTGTYEYTSASAKVTTPNTYSSRVYDETTGTYEYTSASAKVTKPNTYTSTFYDEMTSTYDITYEPETATTLSSYTSKLDYETTDTNDYLSTAEYTTAPTTYVLNGENTITNADMHVSQRMATSTTYITSLNDKITSTIDNTYASDTITTPTPYISRSNYETARTNDYTYASESFTKSSLFATEFSSEPTGAKGVTLESDYTTAPTTYTSRIINETTSTSDTYASESSIKSSTFANGSTYEMNGTKDYTYESKCTTARTTFASGTDQTNSETANIHDFVTNTTEAKDETPNTNNYTYDSESTTGKSIYATGSNDERTSTKVYTYSSQINTTHNGTTPFKTLVTKATQSNNKTSSNQDYTHAPESTATQTIYASNVEMSNTDDYKYTSESPTTQTTYAIRPNDESTVAQTTQTSAFMYTNASKTHASNPSDKTITIEDHTSTSKYITTSALRTTSPNGETGATTVSSADDTGIVPEVANRTHCTKNIDSWGTQWNITEAGSVVSISCFHRNSELSGNIFRECTAIGTWMLPKYYCVRKAIKDIQNTVSSLKEDPPMAVIDDLLGNLSALTAQKQHDDGVVYSGEIQTITSILEDVANLDNIKVTHTQAVAFLETASNLLDPSNTESWQAIDQNSLQNKEVSAAAKLLDSVSLYADVIAQSLNESETEKTIAVANVLLQVRKINDSTEIVFPEGGSYKEFASRTTLYLSRNSLKGSTLFSAVLYRNLSGIISTPAAFNSDAVLGSAVASAKLNSWKSNKDFKITIMFEHVKVNNLSAVCSFRTEKSLLWETDGCSLISSNSTTAICECNHLTNFAILMSPWTKENTESTAINVVSIIGCSVSTLGLLLTMLAHFIFWRYLKSDRVKILMNLCFALMISYIIFICGVDRTENKNGCTIVAVLLHYIYLVVFFLMLAEGIEIFFALIYVFSTKSRLKWILSAAWFIPAVIVGISLAATKRSGYGNNQFCWLSFDNGLIWAFVGPALSIILINSVLLGFVMRAIFRSNKVLHKCKREKALTGIRCLCVLLPLVGCTWIIGIFYVNKSLSWIQYIFAVCNGFQGLVIFIFQCALNKQIRKAYKTVTIRRKSETVSVSLSSPTSKLHITPKSKVHYLPLAKYSVSCSNGAEDLQQGTYNREDSRDDEIDNNWILKVARFHCSEYVPEEDFCTHL